ncbi:unnamed protein product [Fusarium graminearum]|nr:unnamed protein product [Fusarium graminearum]VTO88711.1 unnamed protein product [Fusarium graminearum]
MEIISYHDSAGGNLILRLDLHLFCRFAVIQALTYPIKFLLLILVKLVVCFPVRIAVVFVDLVDLALRLRRFVRQELIWMPPK